MRARRKNRPRPAPRATLLELAAAAAAGPGGEVAERAAAHLEAGGTWEQIGDLFGMVSAFCGWPAALAAHAAVRDLAPPPTRPVARPASRRTARRLGLATFRRVYGPHADAILARIQSYDDHLAELLLEIPYGEIYGRPHLELRDRELAACALLSVLGRDRELRGHALGALRCGATVADLAGVATCVRVSEGAARSRPLDRLLRHLRRAPPS